MLPNRCSIRQNGRQCANPPEFIVTVTCSRSSSRHDSDAHAHDCSNPDLERDQDTMDEYMLGVTCGRHRQSVRSEVSRLQADGKIAPGTVGFSPVKSIGTDCIRADPDALIQID